MSVLKWGNVLLSGVSGMESRREVPSTSVRPDALSHRAVRQAQGKGKVREASVQAVPWSYLPPPCKTP